MIVANSGFIACLPIVRCLDVSILIDALGGVSESTFPTPPSIPATNYGRLCMRARSPALEVNMQFECRILRAVLVASLVSLFVATPVQSEDPPVRELTAGLSVAAFQKEFKARIKKRFAPVSFATHYAQRGRIIVSVVWEKVEGGDLKMKTGLDSATTKKEITDFAKKGYRLERMTATGSGGPDQYSALWNKAPGQELAVRYGYPAQQLLKAHKEFKDKGFEIHSIMPVEVANSVRLSATWEKDDTVLRELQVGLAEGAFRRESRERPKKGYRLVQACGYIAGRRLRFACIWEKVSAGPVQEIHVNLTDVALKKMHAAKIAKGFVPSLIASYSINRRNRYVVAWDKFEKKP